MYGAVVGGTFLAVFVNLSSLGLYAIYDNIFIAKFHWYYYILHFIHVYLLIYTDFLLALSLAIVTNTTPGCLLFESSMTLSCDMYDTNEQRCCWHAVVCSSLYFSSKRVYNSNCCRGQPGGKGRRQEGHPSYPKRARCHRACFLRVEQKEDSDILLQRTVLLFCCFFCFFLFASLAFAIEL